MKEFKDILGDKTETIRHPDKQTTLEHRHSPENADQIGKWDLEGRYHWD
jgi:hypothetical protein